MSTIIKFLSAKKAKVLTFNYFIIKCMGIFIMVSLFVLSDRVEMLWLCFIFFTISTTALTDEEYSHLPRLFHLDDYDKCLWNKDGVYCLGVFELTPTKEAHSVFNLMKKHTKGPYNFNRTLIHRGICVNKRCPSKESNSTQHFEQCVNSWSSNQAMRANLHTLHYCRTYSDLRTVTPPIKHQELFIQVLYAIVLLNVVGTAYDMMTGNKPNKNNLLMAWSIPANWHKLTIIHKGADPRISILVPVQGLKVFTMLWTIYAHSFIYGYGFYVTHPEFFEKISIRSDGLFLSHGSLFVHMFLVITSFLTTYNMLLYSEKQPLRFLMLPVLIVKRICRVSPTSMLLIGYAATWWPQARDGPLISTTIGKNSQVCYQKFWLHAIYVNNIVNKEDICMLPTWYLAVDLQLYTFVCFLTILMWKYSRRAMYIYGTLFFGSCLLNAVVCYVNDWKSIVFLSTSENLRKLFEGVESFSNFYSSTWGALPGFFMGMFMAHLQYELVRKNINFDQYKLTGLLHTASIPLAIFLIIKSAKLALELTSPVQIAGFIGFYQLVFFIIIFVLLFGSINLNVLGALALAVLYPELAIAIDILWSCGVITWQIGLTGPLNKIFAWSRWHAMARMSLSVMLIHWLVGMVIAARPVAYSTSVFDIIVDWLATTAITYILAVPATILLEIPFQRFIDAII